MASLSLSGSKDSSKVLVIAGVIFGLVLIIVLGISYAVAQQARNQLLNQQELKYTPPTTTKSRQVKRILLEREGENGTEYLEILSNGTVNLYDQNHRLIKTSLQGFARINSVFRDIVNNWQTLLLGTKGKYTLTIETNLDTITVTGDGQGGNGIIDDIIDNLDDLGDDTFAPTPTLAPTATPRLNAPTSTPSPTITSIPSPTAVPNPLTPTPLPEYMTAPPFKCSDYASSKPFTISNIICGVDK